MRNQFSSASICRRHALQIGSVGLFGVGLAGVLRAESENRNRKRNARSVILVWLDGGPATIDVWDPKPDSPTEIRGDLRTIATAIPGVRFGESMEKTAKALEHATLVRSLHHGIPDHLPGSQYMMSGNMPSSRLQHPSLGSLSAHLGLGTGRRGMPHYFCLGDSLVSGAGFLGPRFDPVGVRASRRSGVTSAAT